MTIDFHVVNAECRDLQRGDGNDFGASWFSWDRWFCDPMADLGAICDLAGPTRAEYDALDATWGREEDDDYEAYEAAYRAHFRPYFQPHRGECPGIPRFKFNSNDPWWVTPAEIRPALKAIADKGALASPPGPWAGESDQSRWFEWVEFLNRASDHGGFRVG